MENWGKEGQAGQIGAQHKQEGVLDRGWLEVGAVQGQKFRVAM